MIEFQGVWFHIHERALLQDVTLTIPDGQFVALVGRNGSGKTTLARHTNALLQPTRGVVLVDGMPTSDEQHRLDVRRRVGLVFQNPDHQMVGSVVEEDVAFGPENFGWPPEEVRRRVEAALRATGLADLARRPPHTLSGGQKQRLAIAGLLALEPRTMVLDEPTSMLDPEGREEVLAALVQLHREHGMTVVLITHAMDEVALADRVVVMGDGQVVGDTPPAELFSDAGKWEALGLHRPPMAALAARLRTERRAPPAELLTVDRMFDWLVSIGPDPERL